MTVPELSELGGQEFVAALGGVFEDSAWVAERTVALRPFRSLKELHAAMVSVVARADRSEQLALLRAHPDLGTRARMSAASEGEQRGAGLNELNVDELRKLQQLNTEYRDKFGFPFLFAVKGSTGAEVFSALERRLRADLEEEFQEALTQVYRIASFRLRDILGE